KSGHWVSVSGCPLCANSGHELTASLGEHPYSRKENFSTIKWRYSLPMLRGDRSWYGYSSFLTAFRFRAIAPSAPGGSKLHYGQRSKKMGTSAWVGVARSRRGMSLRRRQASDRKMNYQQTVF